jgi:hypothetical protein
VPVTNDINHYVEVFNIASSGYKGYHFASTSFLLFCFSASAYFLNRISGIFTMVYSKRVVGIFFAFFSCLMLMVSIFSFFSSYGEYRDLKNQLLSGKCDVVEGVVTDFQAAPYSGHKDETFKVDGKDFQISDYWNTSAFHQTKSRGGPIDAGKRVRIHNVGRLIVQLEIWKP